MTCNEAFWHCLNELAVKQAGLIKEWDDALQEINQNKDTRNTCERLEEVITDVLKCLVDGKAPLIRISSSNGRSESLISLGATNSCTKFQQLFHTICRSYCLLSDNTYATTRDIYYEHVPLFEKQASVNRCVDDITKILSVPKNVLHITNTAKGLIAGDLKFTTGNGERVDLTSSVEGQGTLIPHHVAGIRDISSAAKYILVVEKDATFQKILDAHFLRTSGPAILVTGKGYPDLCTRELLSLLWRTLKIPVLALTDADPHGLHIAIVYKYGSRVHSDPSLTVPSLCWLGILASEMSSLKIPIRHLLRLRPTDHGKLATLAADSRVGANAMWMREIQSMRSTGFKAEIQHLVHISSDFLTTVYLPTKIRNGGWIE